jgi:hypothetical protein
VAGFGHGRFAKTPLGARAPAFGLVSVPWSAGSSEEDAAWLETHLEVTPPDDGFGLQDFGTSSFGSSNPDESAYGLSSLWESGDTL